MLGAGAPPRSGGEPDFLFRALRAGYKVVNASEVVVDHYGARKPGEEFTKLIMGYGAGTASAMYKHVRLGDPDAIVLTLKSPGNEPRDGTSRSRSMTCACAQVWRVDHAM
jgi:hypothetical protein